MKIMSADLKPVAIGVAVSLALCALVAGLGSAIGVPDKYFGSLFIVCLLVGAFVGVRLVFQEFDREKR